jgi:hypothetical protein
MLPPGVTLGQYLKFTIAALTTMFAGSQVVHIYYRPLQDLDKYIDKELKELPEETRKKIEPLIHRNS